jgi:hypothetical protein
MTLYPEDLEIVPRRLQPGEICGGMDRSWVAYLMQRA